MSVRRPHYWNTGEGPCPVPTPIGPVRGWLFCLRCGCIEAFRWGQYYGRESTIYVRNGAVLATGDRLRLNTPDCPAARQMPSPYSDMGGGT